MFPSKRSTILSLCIGLPLAFSAVSTRAATLATDNAANTAYANGWLTGTNGGTGFGAWTIVADPAGGGEFIGNSGNNGAGNPNGNGGNINTTGASFGMYSATGTSSATRSFTGALTVGQTFNLQMDNGYENNGGVVGFNLLGSDGATRFQFNFTGGGTGYNAVGSTTNNTAANEGFTDGGMSTAFTLTGTNTYSFTVNFNDGNKDTYTGTLAGTAGTTITGVQAFSTAVGTGGQNDAFFNSPSIVPEPSTWAALGLGATLLAGLGRRTMGRRATT